MANQGYMIVRVTNSGSAQPYIAWVHDDTRIAGEMSNWLERGQTVEILEYVPDRDPRSDPFLIPQLNLWRDHLGWGQS